MQVVAAQGEQVPAKTVKTSAPSNPRAWRPYGWSALAVVAAVAVAEILDVGIGFESLSMIFLMPVLYSAVSFGLRPALATSFLGVMAYNFFFIAPRYTFTVANPDNVLALAVLFVVAVIASNLTARIRLQADIAAARARIASELYTFTGKLAGIARLDDIL